MAKTSPTLPADYDATQYERPSVTVDLVVFALAERRLHVLLIRRGVEPYKGKWALPGGFVRPDEDLEAAAHRELREETGIKRAYLEQLYTFGKPDRDPRTRVITVAYFALLPELAEPLTAATDASEAAWHPVDTLPKLAFDHQKILESGLKRVRGKAQYSTVIKGLLPPVFTLGELQRAYEAALGHPLDKRNFRKKILALKLVEATGEQRDVLSSRPAELYRFTTQDIVIFG